MSKFKVPSTLMGNEEAAFIKGAEVTGKTEYPWESSFVRNNPDINKSFSIRLPLDVYMKLEWYQSAIGGHVRNQVVLDLLTAELDRAVRHSAS